MVTLNSRLTSLLSILAAFTLPTIGCGSDANPDGAHASNDQNTASAAQNAQSDGVRAAEDRGALQAEVDRSNPEPNSLEIAGAVPIPVLAWTDCADGFQCATAAVPRDYSHPRGPKTNLAVTRLPARNAAQRIGSLFVNFGGPGGTAVDSLQAFGALLFESLNERFDIVGFDPRGVGQSESPIDCQLNQETQGIYAQPFTTPERLQGFAARARNLVDACVRNNSETTLRYASTANGARDMDTLRAAVGDAKLSYLGFSFGTFLGATYASLFPGNYRALVLDGALDADQYINRPSEHLLVQTAGFERALDRFFEACAANQTACLGFGGTDPHAAFDDLVARANAAPIAAAGDDPRPVDGDDIIWVASNAIYAKQLWPALAQALVAARDGDGTLVRQRSNGSYGRNPDGSYDPGLDRYFALSAIEQRYTSSDVETYLDAGKASWAMFDHAYWNTGYSELPLGLFPVHAQGVFRGPFRTSASSPTILVVGTTYDPATPYREAIRLVAQLRNARLLTMQGDGHTAYGGNSACIDAAVEAYLNQGAVPAAGTACKQEVPFEQFQLQARVAVNRRAALSALRANPAFVRALR
ncbi:MAG TPA: alpha/beta hydrolase [Polyangiaceae bacterium]|nr:alpha/beta hydrolase [Polyangiaceae bacterium]